MLYMKQAVLIIDDELPIRRFLRVGLEDAGYRVVEADEGEKGVVLAAKERPDLIILDLMLPDLYGIDVLQRLREWFSGPILVLSVQGSEDDKIAALDAGADDYLTKPFSTGELLARMRTLLRRVVRETPQPVYRFGDLVVDLGRHVVQRGDQNIHLSSTEYALLSIFLRHVGRVLTHNQLLRELGRPAGETPDDVRSAMQYLRVYVNQLREKIEEDPHRPAIIVTETGVGYRCTEP